MQVPLQVTFRGMKPSPAVEDRIREEATKLEHYTTQLTSCRVVVDKPQHRHHQGDLFHLHIDVTLPGGELLVNRDPSQHHAHEDVYVAIRDAFDATRRRIMDHTRRQRMDVKTHEAPNIGRVVRLLPEGSGFLEAADGHEVYFHRNSVIDGGLAALKVGGEVRFVEEEGERGPQASTVIPRG